MIQCAHLLYLFFFPFPPGTRGLYCPNQGNVEMCQWTRSPRFNKAGRSAEYSLLCNLRNRLDDRSGCILIRRHLYSLYTSVTGDGKRWNNEWARRAVSARNESRVKACAKKCQEKRTKGKVPLTIKWDVERKRLLLWSGTPLQDPVIPHDLPGAGVYSGAKWTCSFSSNKGFQTFFHQAHCG